jgi:hypothetical protein
MHNYSCDGPPGNLPFRWLYGSNVAVNQDPRIQVVQYNEDTYILRENMRSASSFTYRFSTKERC